MELVISIFDAIGELTYSTLGSSRGYFSLITEQVFVLYIHRVGSEVSDVKYWPPYEPRWMQLDWYLKPGLSHFISLCI